jgi:putative ABC transport system ATP-binding protein
LDECDLEELQGGFSVELIRAEGLLRRFRVKGQEVLAVNHVNLTIGKGTFTILKGRSGSGKTTLLNLLGALDYPDAGTLFFDGRDIARLSEDKRAKLRRTEMGFVFQSVALLSMLTAYENVEFGLRMASVPRKGRRARAEECLKMVGLGARMDHRPHEMSGGEQQRAAIARAIAHKPKILFADEPTAELDTHLSILVVKLFRELADKEGITVVMTSHAPDIAHFADQLITLEDGGIIHGQ